MNDKETFGVLMIAILITFLIVMGACYNPPNLPMPAPFTAYKTDKATCYVSPGLFSDGISCVPKGSRQ